MIPALRAEVRKLLTIRSTYIILASCLALEFIFAFYGAGIKAATADLHNPHYLASQVTQAISALSILIALVGTLLVTHEYRYNTIMYTLTSSRRRTYILLTKLIVITVFAVVFSLFFGLLSPLLANLGVHLKGHELVHQVIPVGDLVWRSVFAGWGFAMFALILAFLIRIQVGAIVALFFIPTTVEALIGLILKHNAIYLPFTALSLVLDHNPEHPVSYTHAALTAGIYIVAGWIIAWALFLRRDAN
jgi:ABC-type transport system involved in multi-copper enzyme maturation permease subunit